MLYVVLQSNITGSWKLVFDCPFVLLVTVVPIWNCMPKDNMCPCTCVHVQCMLPVNKHDFDSLSYYILLIINAGSCTWYIHFL